jgi:hypothetical protein
MAKRKREYQGILAEPIIYMVKAANALRGTTADDRSRARKRLADDYERRIDALVEAFGQEPERPDWLALALDLAELYVPGFTVINRPEPGLSDRDKENIQLRKAMRSAGVDRGMSIRNAAAKVARKRNKHGETAAAIDRRYRRLMKEREEK